MVHVSRHPRRGVRIVGFCIALALWSSEADAFQKTDVIELNNGDKITCEIKGLERGKLRCSTDAMGTVYIEWDQIRLITSDKTLEIELSSGQRFYGSIQPGPNDRDLDVVIGEATTNVLQREVAFVTPINPTFWGRLDGSIDLGLSFAQASTQTDFTLDATATYVGRTNSFQTNLSSLIKRFEGKTSNNRHSLDGRWLRDFRGRWFSIALAQGQRNDELDLKVRTSLGGGAGRRLVQTNRWRLMAFGAAVYSRERFFGEENSGNNLEAAFGTDVQVFTFGDHETDVSTSFTFLPSVSDPGRYRLTLNSRVRRELIKDFYFSVNLFETFDSDPPQNAVTNDFSLTTSLGWSF